MAQFRLNYYVSLWNYLDYTGPLALEQIIRSIAGQAFGIELWPHFARLEPYRPSTGGEGDLFDRRHRERLRAALRGCRTGWHGRLYAPDGTIPRLTASLPQHLAQIQAAADLGSAIISVHDLGSDPDSPFGLGGQLDFAQRVLAFAEARRVSIALETLGDLGALLHAVERLPRLKLCLDPAYIQRFVGDRPENYVRALAGRIGYLHLYENTGDKTHHWPGSGGHSAADWTALLRALRDIDYTGPAVLEIVALPGQGPLETAKAAAQYLDALIERYV